MRSASGIGGRRHGGRGFRAGRSGLSASQTNVLLVSLLRDFPSTMAFVSGRCQAVLVVLLAAQFKVSAVAPSLRAKRHHVGFLRDPESNYSEKDSGGGHGCHGKRRG